MRTKKELAFLSKKRTAWHEAGHGVIYAHYGEVGDMTIRCETITHEGRNFRSGGHCKGLPFIRFNSKNGECFARKCEITPLRAAVAGWGGVVSECLYEGNSPDCYHWADFEEEYPPSRTDLLGINGHPHKQRTLRLAAKILERHLNVLTATAERLRATNRGEVVKVGKKWLWNNKDGAGWQFLF